MLLSSTPTLSQGLAVCLLASTAGRCPCCANFSGNFYNFLLVHPHHRAENGQFNHCPGDSHRLHSLTGHLPQALGLPVGINGRAVSLLSGGIDSPVSSWMIAKRGVPSTCTVSSGWWTSTVKWG